MSRGGEIRDCALVSGLNVTVEIVEDCRVLFMLLFNFGPLQVAAQAGGSGVP